MFSRLAEVSVPGAQRPSGSCSPPSGGLDPGGTPRQSRAVSKGQNTQSNTKESGLQ